VLFQQQTHRVLLTKQSFLQPIFIQTQQPSQQQSLPQVKREEVQHIVLEREPSKQERHEHEHEEDHLLEDDEGNVGTKISLALILMFFKTIDIEIITLSR